MARTQTVKVLVEPEEKSVLEKAASDNGLTLSSLMRMAALAWAREKGYLK